MGEIIGVVSGKGGVGKTTITACLGSALSNAGHRVLLCDGDFGLRDLDLVLGVANEIIYDALDASEDKDYMDDAIVSIAENLDFLPASQSARWEDIGRKKYKKLVRRLSETYDYILIDAPAGIGKGIESILELVNRCIVVTHPLWVSLRNGARMIQVCQEHNIRDYAIAFNAVPIDGEDIPSLATVGESIFENSNNVHYINRGGWTTQRLLVQGKQSLWRRSKLK